MRPILIMLALALCSAAGAAPGDQPTDAKTAPSHKVVKTDSKSKPDGKTKSDQAKGQHHRSKPAVATQHPAQPATPPVVAAPAAPSTPEPASPAEPPKGTVTGMALPRFASLRTDEVNLRTGPGTRYPVEWVYKRRDLPVEIEREFEVWRLVRDADGVKGWVHQATLTGKRSFYVTGGLRALRESSADTAAAVAMLKPGVVGRIRNCDAASEWCQVQVGDYRGYLKRDEFWGTLPKEGVGS